MVKYLVGSVFAVFYIGCSGPKPHDSPVGLATAVADAVERHDRMKFVSLFPKRELFEGAITCTLSKHPYNDGWEYIGPDSWELFQEEIRHSASRLFRNFKSWKIEEFQVEYRRELSAGERFWVGRDSGCTVNEPVVVSQIRMAVTIDAVGRDDPIEKTDSLACMRIRGRWYLVRENHGELALSGEERRL